MYRTIHVPVDNSDHSSASIELAARLGKALGSTLVGSHVYAAKLHDVRFKQMEFTLPDEYKEEEELEKQRKIHDALIGRGLHLISDSYLDQMDERCQKDGIAFERKHFDGRNFEAIARDIRESAYGLVVMGALGMGAVKGSQVGSVCERVLRRTQADTLVVRNLEAANADTPGPIVCCLDGSTWSYGALRSALVIGRALDRQVQVVAVRDANDPAGELLARHVDVARAIARKEGLSVAATVLEGGARAELFAYLRAARPWLVTVGRAGIDAADTAGADGAIAHVGATSEHLLRTGEWNLLLSATPVAPEVLLERGATAAA